MSQRRALRISAPLPSLFVSFVGFESFVVYDQFVRRMKLGVALLVYLCFSLGCAATDTLSAPSPVAAPETAIHIFSLSPRAGSTLDYGSPIQITGHYTFSAQDSVRRATTTMWLCLGVDRETFITDSCAGGHHSATDEFNETATLVASSVQPRPARVDTAFAHLLLVDGPLIDRDALVPSTSRISQISGVLLTGLTFPHVIHWQ